MRNLFRKLWKDDAGTVAMEYLLVGTVLSLALIKGLSNLEVAINVELSELGNALLALSQGYQIACQSGCKAVKDGSNAHDTPGSVTFFVGDVRDCEDSETTIDIDACP